jgi:glutathione S-transferase
LAIEVFWGSGSPFSWRVLLALELKRVPYESRLLSFAKGEHKTPEFLAISPRGRVPAVRDGEVTVWESVACVAYVDRKHPDPPLFGATPEQAARIWRIVCETLSYLDPLGDAFILPFYFGRAEAEAESIRAIAPKLADELARVERELAGGAPFLAGTTSPTAADCVVYPMIRSVVRALEKPAAAAFAFPFANLTDAHPAIGAWMKRVEALPGYDRTFPPHWRTS